MSQELEIIRQIAGKFRKQIVSGKIAFIGSEDFPHGCCGNASERLQFKLINEGFESVKLIANRFIGEQSHAWLEYKGYIIDITADQFDDFEEEVFIMATIESDFHKQFL